MVKAVPVTPLQPAECLTLAEFRYQLRKFLRHMEERTRALGASPQQYQLVLALKGLPQGQSPTIRNLAERMQLNHNSMVELVDRCERRGLLPRVRSKNDRRQVALHVTAKGETLLRKLGAAAREELRGSGPSLVAAILGLTRRPLGKRN
jgi:DNA-binding MarR family transcriptional regulator